MLPTLFRPSLRSTLGKEDGHPLASLRGEIDRLFQDFFGDSNGLLPRAASIVAPGNLVPPMDVKERDDAYVAELEMPGMKAEQFHVEVDDGVLAIRGERKVEKDEKGEHWHRSERAFGSFERRIALPAAVDAEKVDASYKDGVLTVTVPKVPGPKPRTVTVKAK